MVANIRLQQGTLGTAKIKSVEGYKGPNPSPSDVLVVQFAGYPGTYKMLSSELPKGWFHSQNRDKSWQFMEPV